MSLYIRFLNMMDVFDQDPLELWNERIGATNVAKTGHISDVPLLPVTHQSCQDKAPKVYRAESHDDQATLHALNTS